MAGWMSQFNAGAQTPNTLSAAMAQCGAASGWLSSMDIFDSLTQLRSPYKMVIGYSYPTYGYRFNGTPQYGTLYPGNIMGKAVIGNFSQSDSTARPQLIIDRNKSIISAVTLWYGGASYAGRNVVNSTDNTYNNVWYFDTAPLDMMYGKQGQTIYFGLSWANA